MKSADGRVATAATRRERENLVQRKTKNPLTPTGLLMEGDYTHNRVNECNLSPIKLPYADCGKAAMNNPAIV